MAVGDHARSLLDLADRVEVRGCWSRSAAHRAAFAAEFPLPVVEDPDALIADPAVELAFVLTPPDARRDLVERLARAGVVAAVMLQLRSRPASLRLAELVAAGALGELAAAQLTMPWWCPQACYDEPGRGTLARDGGGC